MLTRLGLFLVGAVLLVIPPGNASGSDLRILESNSEVEISVAVDSIKTIEGSHTEVGVLTIYRKTQRLEDMPPFEATYAVLFIKCGLTAASLSKLVFLSNSDKPVAKFDFPVQWNRVNFKSDVGIVWRYVCTHGWERDQQ